VKIVTIVGARPQFIKAAPVSKELRKRHTEYLVHTGQHYDKNMSNLFFDELGIPQPYINLNIGSGPHALQTGQMMIGIEGILTDQQPDLVLVYGDTNSTLAGAIAGSKLNIPIAHVEAGLRSFNKKMPEEVNRILTDKISDYLFCPTQTAVKHLKAEGISNGVSNTGDVMYDASLYFSQLANEKEPVLDKFDLQPKQYILATCHRPQNTDDKEAMTNIISAFIESDLKVVFPVHPRTRTFLEKFDLLEKIKRQSNLVLAEPVGYLEMVQLEQNAKKILTDSGGVQKEAYFYKVPCITMRPETEWTETVEDGWNKLVNADKNEILLALETFNPNHAQNNHYGDGKASVKIAESLPLD
jgi:UDP-N-acetylglucosamine 2-epimerase